MSRYDFNALSSQDLEELTRDLLQAEWNVRLEAFKTGRDKGIDLRRISIEHGTTIIQCKHYSSSGFKKLVSDLAKNEKPKIELLKPGRYILVTSVGLTPPNKDEIVRILNPYISSPNDVIGAEDIDGLLSRHPSVERANFKLWLTSTSVIERVLHNATVCQTEFEVERITSKLPLYVQSPAYLHALETLDRHRIVVISGPPGIGKTTLAEMLLFSHLDQGFEPVVIKGDISEGKTFFRKEAKRIFYYDDFLGQIYLKDHTAYLGRNGDAALTDFLEMVKRSEHCRFILTTRPHLLSTARHLSERLANSSALDHKCVLELSSYTMANRARILYNHLYFSDLSTEHKKAILREDFFLIVIRHTHFNPRLIEWLSSRRRIKNIPAADYRDYITALLENPHEIWRGAFHQQISEAARAVLLCFYTLGSISASVDLEEAFYPLHSLRARKYNHSIASGDFKNALRELDGAFFEYSNGQVSYLNPSIREFVSQEIYDDRNSSEDLIESALRTKQIWTLWGLAREKPTSALNEAFLRLSLKLPQKLQELFPGPFIRWEQEGRRPRGVAIDLTREYRLEFISEVGKAFQIQDYLRVVLECTRLLISTWERTEPDFRGVIRLIRTLSEDSWTANNGGRTISEEIWATLLQHLPKALANDWLPLLEMSRYFPGWSSEHQKVIDHHFQEYKDDGLMEERSDCSNSEELTSLMESLIKLQDGKRVNFKTTIDSLEEDIEEAEREEASASRSTEDGGGYRESPYSEPDRFNDDDARQMFATLELDS